jgi:phosphoribosylformylglycinamidine synthase
MGIVHDSEQAVTMDLKAAGNLLLMVGETCPALGGSHFAVLSNLQNETLPQVDLEAGPRNARAVASLISEGLVRSAHDLSEGGLLVAAAEMAFAGGLGIQICLDDVPTKDYADQIACAFSETPSRYLLEIRASDRSRIQKMLAGVSFAVIGEVEASDAMVIRSGRDHERILLETLRSAWACGCDDAFGVDR